jgi:uncharacterized protein YdeI (YjbR/CyaY-like superfamily)
MSNRNPNVDQYLLDGCGRCDLYQTPQCKVHNWEDLLTELRRIVLASGLKEDFKWSQPCYTHEGKNVLMVTALKPHAVLSFFKGVLLKDPHHLLVAPGKNSQSDRQFRFTQVEDILDNEAIIAAYIQEAIQIEKDGREVDFQKSQDPIPIELQQKFAELPELRQAFFALTPGRQRGYLLHFNQAKQSKTRLSRIEKYIPWILDGTGIHDGWKKNVKNEM